MRKEVKQSVEDKALKTGKVVVAANLIVLPFYCIDSTLGLAVSVAVNAVLLKVLHDLGQSRRPGSNLLNAANRFFSNMTGSENHEELNNTFRNIINGGAAVYDEMNCVYAQTFGR
ncbi:hypothetical protein DIZ81_02835 [Legionella taurinensis]|uniref:Uncharacterized protein n=1 Tax=Legionella taurinensis TaxID=70611 RepID=A0A3A5L4C0_9GAMM|nr:hypothetical protein [Legionella taurinensis]MDX1836190.1 hypothetical protein [Legionella taurinensis]PUT42045.1 hypothetical protein DB744_02840 [Legionella taurinensis]PUT44832.1 hypothetical protein DB746_02840 [Legionella taurinensis]PUT48153.1 hypothetical protein DB743_01000 [Legionella taurinensis]PUT48967.1 hypothetical protein DB745_02840 [Legionella taurinensis]